MKRIDWNNVKEVNDNYLTPGGYVCGITSVEDVPAKEYLKFEFDIVEGEFKNYYRALSESKGFWGGSFIKSYKEKALGFFKQMLTCFEKSNNGFVFVDDEKTFRGKYIGLVLSEEEYIKNDNSVGKRLYVSDIKSIFDIKNGEFEVKPLKTIEGRQLPSTPTNNANSADFDEISDDDLPWA